ncbi:MAG: hypothetical protein O7C75_11770 [Verrucomicrobia bacterium]|nr:hypothetical protein [Verrucomicrobiota bacterium]
MVTRLRKMLVLCSIALPGIVLAERPNVLLFKDFGSDCFFVRNDRFRLHEDGRLYEAPTYSNETRYNMNIIPINPVDRRQLQEHLSKFMHISKTNQSYRIIPFGTGGDNFKNTQQKVNAAKK